MSDAAATRTGLIIIVSAPSGGGKTSLCQRLLNWSPNLMYSVSCTTRVPRSGEQHGREYFFLPRPEFERRIAAQDFLEFAEYNGHYYGTPRSFVDEQLQAGKDVLLDLEVQGAGLVSRCVRGGACAYPDALVKIFLMPPSLELLERRLRRRGTETEDMIERRLSVAEQEMGHWREYDYVIISGPLDDDFEQAKSILIAEKCRTARQYQGTQPWERNELSF